VFLRSAVRFEEGFVKIRFNPGRNLIIVAVFALLCALFGGIAAGPAFAEKWLCPVCQVQRIDRPDSTAALVCPKCQIEFQPSDLTFPVGYLSIRTRPSEVVWNLTPECGIFRNEGLLVFDKKEPQANLWVPWSAVDYYIPRQRIVKLTSGDEFLTPYSQSKEQCPEPPKFIVSIADSVGDFLNPGSIRVQTKEEPLSVIFLVARSPSARDSAKARFIREVESGKHPRLPRTQPTIKHIADPAVPRSAVNDSVDVVIEVRVDENGQILKLNRLKGSGNKETDQAALVAARRSVIYTGGEMGAGVPTSVILTFHFNRGTVTTEGRPAVPPMWREWLEPPQ
jgi:TonB family protein